MDRKVTVAIDCGAENQTLSGHGLSHCTCRRMTRKRHRLCKLSSTMFVGGRSRFDAGLNLGGFGLIAGRLGAQIFGSSRVRSPVAPFPNITPLARVNIAHRAWAYSTNLMVYIIRPGELAAAQPHVCWCSAGHRSRHSWGRVSDGTVNLM